MNTYDNIKFFKDLYNKKTFSDTEAIEYFESIGSVTDLTKWELVTEEPVDYDKEDDRADIELSTSYRVVYKYTEVRSSGNSRDFCKRMMSLDKEYTKEEIKAFNSNSLNPGWGPNGGKYSIWKYKGGSWCHHAWYRRTYKSIDGGPEEIISSGQARKEGYRDPSNESEVSIAPINMPNGASLKHKK